MMAITATTHVMYDTTWKCDGDYDHTNHDYASQYKYSNDIVD